VRGPTKRQQGGRSFRVKGKSKSKSKSKSKMALSCSYSYSCSCSCSCSSSELSPSHPIRLVPGAELATQTTRFGPLFAFDPLWSP